MNCAALAEQLLEAELFGHVKGAFTGAIANKPGRFQLADGGTLFLDEIGDLSPKGQGDLLRVLEDGAFRMVGGSDLIRVNVRVIAATNKKLGDAVAQGKFREDLFYRLQIVPIVMPPLRERAEDIPLLIERFFEQFAAKHKRRRKRMSAGALQLCQRFPWPGNVRQLRNVIERTIILAPGERLGRIDADMLPPEILSDQAQLAPGNAAKSIMGAPLREARETFEREYLRVQIRRFSGNISRTAAFIGMERSALHRKLKSLGLADTRVEEE